MVDRLSSIGTYYSSFSSAVPKLRYGNIPICHICSGILSMRIPSFAPPPLSSWEIPPCGVARAHTWGMLITPISNLDFFTRFSWCQVFLLPLFESGIKWRFIKWQRGSREREFEMQCSTQLMWLPFGRQTFLGGLRDSAIGLSQRLPVVVLFGRAELLCRTCHIRPFLLYTKGPWVEFRTGFAR